MAPQLSDDIDLAERGIKPRQTADSENTLQDTSSVYDGQELTGRTGSARLRQKAPEFRFFPACERPLFMVLDYLAAKSWEVQETLEQLELENRQAMETDYKEHRPDNDFGKQKELLMDKQTKLVNTYYKIFNNAKGVLSQPSPDVQYVNGFRRWASYHLSPDPADEHHAADNYRFVGPRPSNIDALFHSFLDAISTIWPFRRRTRRSPSNSGERVKKGDDQEQEEEGEEEDEGDIIIVEHSNALFRAFSHAVMITFAFVFLLLPPTMVCLVDMSELMTVVVMVAFCLSFFLVIVFFFGSLSTEHKFLLFFAYCGAMVTMLSSIARNDVSISIPGVTGI